MTPVNLPENPFELTHLPHGCGYCFARLDPDDGEPTLRNFVQCNLCQSTFHANCWQKNGQCIKCAADTAIPVNELSRLPINQNFQPIQASTVKPSAVYYDLWWGTYLVPRFMLEKIVPWYNEWQPRTAATLRSWHVKIKSITHDQLTQASLRLLSQNQESRVGQFTQAHLHRLATVFVFLFYVLFYLLLRWLLIWVF